MRAAILGLLVAGMGVARAADGGTAPPPDTTAAEVRDAPPPDQASGTTTERDDGHGWLWVPRVLLFIPRWTAEIVFAPVRGALWVFEKYEIREKLESIFFNDEGTMGLYPLAFFETGFGLNVGARFVYRDIFGHGERLRLRASYGGRFRQLYAAKLTTGTLLGDRVMLDLRPEFEIYPKSRFFGFGNGDLQPPADVVMPVDPRLDDTAVETRFRHDDVSIDLGVSVRLPLDLSLRPSAVFLHRDFRDDADLQGQPLVTDIYQRNALVGIDDLRSLRGELELTYDSRRPTRDYLSTAMPATGWKLSGFGGYAHGLGDDPSSYSRYGADLLRYLDLHRGDRVLVLRTYLEALAGDPERVPFTELPSLGGPSILRGYPRHRFRDRVAVLGSAEYIYPIARQASGYLFLDTGRVYRSFSDFAFEEYRLGYGGGLYIFTGSSFLASLAFSSSSDGGFFFNLGFDPVYDVRARTEAP